MPHTLQLGIGSRVIDEQHSSSIDDIANVPAPTSENPQHDRSGDPSLSAVGTAAAAASLHLESNVMLNSMSLPDNWQSGASGDERASSGGHRTAFQSRYPAGRGRRKDDSDCLVS